MEKMEEYRQKLEAQLKEWKVRIEQLEDKAVKATGETRDELLKAVDELRQKKGVVKDKLNELQKESGAVWEQMKERVDTAASELKSALERVISRFK